MISLRTTVCVLALLTAGALAPHAAAQERDEAAAMRERAEMLMREAVELDAIGRERAAEAARREAELLLLRVQERETDRRRDRAARDNEGDWRREAVARLEGAMEALDRLERHDARDLLARIADDIRRELDAPVTDRRREASEPDRQLHGELNALRLAAPPLAEEDRGDALELLERAIHAREMAIEGREEALREGPGPRQIARVLAQAEQIYRRRGDLESADKLSAMAEEHFGRARRDTPQRRRSFAPSPRDVEAMELAVHALLEADRVDEAEALRRGLQAWRQMRMSPQPDVPSPQEQRELLVAAAEIWERFGNDEAAGEVRALLGRTAQAALRVQRQAGRRSADEPGGQDRIEQLERRLDELQGMIERLRAEMAELIGAARQRRMP